MSSPSFLDVETTNADELTEAISAGFGYRVAASSRTVAHRQHVIVGNPVTIADLQWDAEVRVAFEATDEVVFVEVHSGAYAFNPWGCDEVIGEGGAFVTPPDQALEFVIDHAVASTCSFSAQLLRRVAREVWDDDGVRLAEGTVRPVDAARHWLWRRTVQEYRQQVLETPDVYGNELLRAEASRFVVVSAISAFGLVTEPRREASVSAAVRRATAWVDEHRREPITVQDIAAAARLSPRGLSLAFRRERGQTPMEYVRLARVDGARADLLAGDPTRGDTVAGIAADWGFSNAGRFTALYRRTYGEAPRRTLMG
ncbi:helix-turn-helix transcriptional regulator [Curtobacterium herbarum]|uniref:HTH araC/xylS-type domain-containing protein n=1 Tax=Curtobacterium herbarum TaxID=150122 RepID=A0ABN1ZCE6_9MICO|nr:helix-turn-helix domain-containing protein [Curtobacterium herbarum]MBM7476957.1 AraC-like DNA-binding protein [Curtobacterium herbarum]MCS6545033.1 helix-turn-helix transcriptional regulator [Curtobacterium herbarum]